MKIFRWQGILVLFILTTFIIAFYLFIFDKVLKKSLEKSLSFIIQKPVEINSLSFSLPSLSLQMNNIQIADSKDPYKNLVQIRELVIDLSSKKLAFKKYDIENFKLLDAEFNIKRKFPAKVLEKREKKKEKSVEKTKIKIPQFAEKLKFPSVEEILSKEQLRSRKVYTEYKNKIEDKIKNWEEKYKKLEKEKEELKNLKKELKEIEKKIKKIKSVEDLKTVKKQIETLKDRINSKISFIKELKNQLEEDKKLIKTAYKDIQTASIEDYNYLRKKYTFDVEGSIKLAELIFGENFAGYIEKALKVYQLVTPYLKRGEEKQKEIEKKGYRLEGKYVKYREYNPYPDLVIRKGDVSFLIKGSKLYGSIKNFSDNQKIYRKPFEIHLGSTKGKNFEDFKFYMMFDRTKDISKDSFKLNIKKLYLDDIKVGDLIKFKNNVISLNSDVYIKDEKTISGFINLLFLNVKPDISKTSEYSNVLSQILKSINTFFIKVNIIGSIDDPEFSIRSDLDEKLGKGLRNFVRLKVEKLNKELKKQIQLQKDGYLKQINKYKISFGKYESLLKGYEDEYKGILNEVKRKLTIKPLEKKLKKKLLEKLGF